MALFRVVLVLVLTAAASPFRVLADEEAAHELWSARDATGEEDEAAAAEAGAPTIRAAKALGAGARIGNVFLDPRTAGIEGFSHLYQGRLQAGIDLQTSNANLVETIDEQPMTTVTTLKYRRDQLTLFGRYFFRPETYVAAGLGIRRTMVAWSANERLGTATAHAEQRTTAGLVDVRLGQQWAFKKGYYVAIEAAEYTATFSPRQNGGAQRGGARSLELDEVIAQLDERARREGRRHAWEFFSLCAGKMF